MTEIFTPAVVWWISVVDVPLLGAAIAYMVRFRREIDVSLSAQDKKYTRLTENLADFKLEVAKNYASMLDLKDVESRLIAHLLRIEAKLDQTALRAASIQFVSRSQKEKNDAL